jgi:hypothetical protein
MSQKPSTPAEAVAAVADKLDIGAVQKHAEAVLAEPMLWFPVRHHSPGVARYLRETLLAKKPKVVFMEGPAEANDLIKFITDAKTKPPVALYTSYRDDDNVLGLAGIESPAVDIPARFATWYPMLPYSPEYVALMTAREMNVPVVFVDLPHHALIKSAKERGVTPEQVEAKRKEEEERKAKLKAEGKDPEEDDDEAKKKEKDDLAHKTWEQAAVESQFYKVLAETAGYRSWNECWDSLFEIGGRHTNAEEFRRDMAYFCSAVRATTPKERIERDGTLERERHMWQSIQRELKERKLSAGDAMMVCGGFHLFMDRDEKTPPPPLPKGTVYSTVAPYSYFRTSELTGYGAGNRAPRYYQLLWEGSKDDPDNAPVDAMVEHVVAVLGRGRKEGDNLSSADAISVTQHARMLATLRGRKAPTLDDIRDALISCCCKGRPDQEGRHLMEAITHVEVGTAVGRVTPDLGRLPLVHDFYAQIDHLDLGEVMGKDKSKREVLDLREEPDARKSVFFHRLVQLAVPMAELKTSGGDGATLFQESWVLNWSPKVESELIEKNLYGDSVEAAATALLDEELAKEADHAGKVCERLHRAVNMDLPGMVLRLEQSAGAAIDVDKRLGSLASALNHLLMLERLAAQRTLRRDVITELVVRCFGRACFSIPDVIAVPDEEQREVIESLKALAEALLGEKSDLLDKDLFRENVLHAFQNSPVPYLRGAFAGILTEIRAQTAEELAAQVSAYSRERPEVMITAGEFLDGLMAVSKTSILLGADALVGAIDELLRAASWDQFVTMLPRVRNAFEQLHDRQRHSLADRVAVRYGLKDGEKIARLSTSAEAAVQMAAIDLKVAELMKEWSL